MDVFVWKMDGLGIILQNPYRVLGVYANSSKKDIASNKAKATAFLKVNKPVEFPLDLKGILPATNRTPNLMNEAEAHLAIAKEQIKFAQFWFLQKMTPLDDIAFNHLLVGNMTDAKKIWSKEDSLSSLQNKLVCYLIENKPWLAVKTAEKLYKKFGTEYVRKINANSTLQMTATELLHQFIDSLGEEIGMQKLLGYELGSETKDYISSQTIGPLINKISTEVEKTKKVDHKDPKARIEAARKLVNNTKEPFGQLKSILPANDAQYQMIADKLGLEILQCGIDYFNNSEDDDAGTAKEAMCFLKDALSIVVGTMAKQRCEENVRILQEKIDELPPQKVVDNDIKLKVKLGRYIYQPNTICDAKALLEDTKPILNDIKSVLGPTHKYYLKVSTLVIRAALNKVVDHVNDVQGDPQIANRLQSGLELQPFQSEKLKSTLQDAWVVTTMMDDFDLKPDFRPHYNKNRNTLKSMCKDFGIPTNEHGKPSNTADNTGNASAWESFWEHLKSYKSSRWQAATIMTIIGGFVGFLVYYNNPETIAVDKKWSYILWGSGIGAISWFCILYDNDEDNLDTSGFGNGGCIGALFLIALFIYYWIYKGIRLIIDEIKGT